MSKKNKILAKALVNFSDKTSLGGIRKSGDIFETTEKHIAYLNGLRDFKLVEIVIPESDSENVSDKSDDISSKKQSEEGE